MGVEPALCVNVNGDFGVLCLGHKTTFCSTCKHSSMCKHIRKLISVVEKNPIEELPPQLLVFTKHCEVPIATIQPAHEYTKAVSTLKIPFSFLAV